MTDQYFVLKRIPTGDTKVPFAEALEALEREKNRTPCHNCGSRQYEWYHRNAERAHCSECVEVDYLKQRDEAIKERDKARRSSDDYERRWHSARKQRDEARAALKETIAQLDDILAAPPKPSCLNCGSADYVWHFNNGESAYCSKCSPDTPPPPKPSLKFLPCPECGRMLTTLSEHLPPGRCCLCGAELSPPVCPKCGYDRFSPCGDILKYARFKADGALSQPKLYFFRCSKCGEEVGTLPLKRTDK